MTGDPLILAILTCTARLPDSHLHYLMKCLSCWYSCLDACTGSMSLCSVVCRE